MRSGMPSTDLRFTINESHDLEQGATMSILLYRDKDGLDRTIQNPTEAGWSECCRIICERNKAAIEREFLRGMQGSLLLNAIADSHS